MYSINTTVSMGLTLSLADGHLRSLIRHAPYMYMSLHESTTFGQYRGPGWVEVRVRQRCQSIWNMARAAKPLMVLELQPVVAPGRMRSKILTSGC